MSAIVFSLTPSRRVIVSEFSPNCYTLISTRKADSDRGNGVDVTVSFLVTDEHKHVSVEWEPVYGPISINRACVDGSRLDPVIGPASNDWTQMGVESSGLPILAASCCYEQIFDVLKGYL